MRTDKLFIYYCEKLFQFLSNFLFEKFKTSVIFAWFWHDKSLFLATPTNCFPIFYIFQLFLFYILSNRSPSWNIVLAILFIRPRLNCVHTINAFSFMWCTPLMQKNVQFCHSIFHHSKIVRKVKKISFLPPNLNVL